MLKVIYKKNRTEPAVFFQNRTETEPNLKNPFRTSLHSMRSLILNQCRDLRIGETWQNLGALTTAQARQSSAFYPEFLQHFLPSSSFNCFIVYSEYLLAILTANYWYTVTQPSTCLLLSDNTAGTITRWRRLPEEFCRNPIWLFCVHLSTTRPGHPFVVSLLCSRTVLVCWLTEPWVLI